MLRESRCQLADISIATTEFGSVSDSDYSIVYLHGWLDNAASFTTTMHVVRQLNPKLHQCAVDLPGHGLSSHKEAGNYYPFHDYIDDLHQFLAILSPNKLLLVGHSLGALIASCYSAAFPEQVAALVQIEGNGPLAESSEYSLSRLRGGITSRSRIRSKPARQFSSLDEMITRRAKLNHVSAEQIAPIVQRGSQPAEHGWQLRHDRKLQSDSLYRMSPAHADEIRQHIVCPQLVILGSNGYPSLQQVSDTLADVVVLDGGHHCHLEQPEQVALEILALVNKI
ncbi:alpha/beta fold hydrolase [Vibrio taketomensis]|uniref:alpha/beta fold hydrolase n=1 Tax=Vibrio taketomensis TaxID=2572923 RepID=UPI001389E48A|nr:alpha/beta hydrolase [Vibrio taketomensis]